MGIAFPQSRGALSFGSCRGRFLLPTSMDPLHAVIVNPHFQDSLLGSFRNLFSLAHLVALPDTATRLAAPYGPLGGFLAMPVYAVGAGGGGRVGALWAGAPGRGRPAARPADEPGARGRVGQRVAALIMAVMLSIMAPHRSARSGSVGTPGS
jgi:hypothetical protein